MTVSAPLRFRACNSAGPRNSVFNKVDTAPSVHSASQVMANVGPLAISTGTSWPRSHPETAQAVGEPDRTAAGVAVGQLARREAQERRLGTVGGPQIEQSIDRRHRVPRLALRNAHHRWSY